jgi:hypothetical protein
VEYARQEKLGNYFSEKELHPKKNHFLKSLPIGLVLSPPNLPKPEQTRKVYPVSANCHLSVLFERLQQHLYKEYFMAGYNPHFLRDIHLPLPEFTTATSGQIAETTELREGIYADYINYTVVTIAKYWMRMV